MRARGSFSWRRAAPPCAVVAVCLPVLSHFFETFPGGWDQTEYVWCVKDGYLPHSPYVGLILLGRLVHLVFAPAIALSLISCAAGVAAIALSWWLVPRAGGESDASTGWSAAILLGFSSVFVRQATTQEVYALQTALVLGAAAILVTQLPRRHVWSGLVFGCALTVHNSSAFLLPALAVLLLDRRDSGGMRWKRARGWAGSAGLVIFCAYAWVAWVIPVAPGERLTELATYLRGMPPGLELASLADRGFAARSGLGIVERLTSGDIPVTRGPLATGPVGASWLHLLSALAGLGVLAAGKRKAALFWLLWAAPFVVYELALGWNLDYGTYLVFLMPPLCALCGHACGWLRGRGPAALGFSLLVVLLTALLVTPVRQLAAQWNDPETARRQHGSPTMLAAVWAASALPPNAVVIQARREWNANLLPLYAERRHITRAGHTLRLFRSRGPWTPMKPDAYDLLTTETLSGLLESGRPVFAFDPEPLRGANFGQLDPRRFAWKPVAEVDLEGIARSLGLEETARRLKGRSQTVHQATRREARQP